MIFLDLIQTTTTVLTAISQFATAFSTAKPAVMGMAERLTGRLSYENLALDYVFDIRDPGGRRATIKRRQRVRFRVEDSGVIRDLVWGEGNPLAGYAVVGARCAGVRQEGSKRVVLLALPRKPSRGDQATVATSRTVRDPAVGPAGYAESWVERPTAKLSLKVVFPRSRPPTEAHLVTVPTSSDSRRLKLRYGSDGRPYLSWRKRKPHTFTTYSMRWAW